MSLTKVQRDVLGWMMETDGRAIFVLGHKQTAKGVVRSDGDPAIAMSVNVYEGLLRNHLVRAARAVVDERGVSGTEFIVTIAGAVASGGAVACAIGDGCDCDGWHHKGGARS